MFELNGQTAIVTGAANGIGEVIARRLANAGARVAIADIDEQAAVEAADRIGEHAFPVRLDITDANSRNRLSKRFLPGRSHWRSW